MKHLKLFENKISVAHICNIIDHHSNVKSYIFYNIEDMNNFIINYVHHEFEGFDDESVKNIFDIKKLINIYNDNSDDIIHLNSAKILENVKLDTKLKTRMDALKYNL